MPATNRAEKRSVKNRDQIILAAAAIASAPLSAHHSPIIFDTDSVVVLQGQISRYDWANPHSYIFVEAVNDNGETTEWQLETDATPILQRNGWTPESLVPGDLVSVRASPDRRTDRAHAMLISLEKENGSVLTPTSGDQNAPSSVPRDASLAGIWEQRFENFLEFRIQGLDVETTAKGTAARAAYEIRTDNPVSRCVAYPSPMIVAAPQYLNEITLHADRVTIRTEFYDVERTIFTDGRDHPENTERTNQGHSIGTWDGNVLVVDTTLFAEHRSTLPGTGLPSGPQKHVVERYALSEDGTEIRIDFMLEDPEFLAEPFTGTLEWHQSAYAEISAFGCTLDQATRFMSEPLVP
jgi:hypothetical protein